MKDEPEESVATLVLPDEYVRHLNQVAGVTSRDIIFVKRKFVSASGHELVRHPIATCARVRRVDERPISTLVSGVLLAGLIGFVFYMLVAEWHALRPGTRIPIGLLVLGGGYAIQRVIGARRHRLVFTMKDKTRLTWTSRPGDYQIKRVAVERIVEFARSLEILDDSRLMRG